MDAQVVGEVANEVTKDIIVKFKEWYRYTRNYHSNIQQLENKYNNLKNHEETICNQVERDKGNLRKSTPLTDEWLSKARELMAEDGECKQLLDEEKRKGLEQCCFGGLHCNLYQRYVMSKTAQDIAKEVEVLIKEEPPYSRITEPIPRSELIAIPNEFLKSLESRVQLKMDVLNKLREDEVDVVGVFGMGAIDSCKFTYIYIHNPFGYSL